MHVLLISGGLALSVLLSLLLLPEKPQYFFGPFFALVAFVPTFMLLSRRMGEKVRPFFEAASRHAQARNFPQAIEELQKALAYKNWQLFLRQQVHSEIGLLHYAAGDDKKAVEFLRDGYPKVSTGHLILASILYRDGKLDEARAALERGITFNKRSPILYNLLAWMLSEKGQREAAMEVLARCQKADPGDEATADNLTRLQNDKKMNMKSFGDMWYMLRFETPRGMAVQPPFRKGFRQPPKPTKKGGRR